MECPKGWLGSFRIPALVVPSGRTDLSGLGQGTLECLSLVGRGDVRAAFKLESDDPSELRREAI